jgi:tetratricopeptide (TPR) repeat protein
LTLNNIGLVYYQIENFRKAISYYQEAEKLKLRIKDTYDLDRLLTNIGLCYMYLNEFETATEFFNRALLLCDNDQNITMETQFGMAICNYLKGDLKAAREYGSKSCKKAAVLSNNRFYAENLILLARVCLSEHKYDAARAYLQEAERLSAKSGYSELRMETYEHLSRLYYATEMSEKETIYRTKYIDLQDTLRTEAVTQNLMVAQAEYEQRKNNATIESQDNILNLKENLIVKQKWLITFSITAVGLLFFVLILVYRSNRQNRLSQASLEWQVKEDTKILQQKYEALERSFQTRTSYCRKIKDELKSKAATLSGLFSVIALKRTPNTQAQLNSSLSDLANPLSALADVADIVIFRKTLFHDDWITLQVVEVNISDYAHRSKQGAIAVKNRKVTPDVSKKAIQITFKVVSRNF